MKHKQNSYLPIVTRNAYGYVNLIIPKITQKIRDCEFLCIGKNAEKYVYLFAQKKNWKRNPTEKITTKVICLDLLIVQDMNGPLESLLNTLSHKIYNRKCKYCIKCKDCKNVRSVKVKV